MGRFESGWELGDMVYVKTDVEQLPRMITEITFSITGATVYSLTQMAIISYHSDKEFTDECDTVMKMDNV